jgi:hypothetical protein
MISFSSLLRVKLLGLFIVEEFPLELIDDVESKKRIKH